MLTRLGLAWGLVAVGMGLQGQETAVQSPEVAQTQPATGGGAGEGKVEEKAIEKPAAAAPEAVKPEEKKAEPAKVETKAKPKAVKRRRWVKKAEPKVSEQGFEVDPGYMETAKKEDQASVKELHHNPRVIPTVNCGMHMVTTILLPPAEKILPGVQAGNTQMWGITPVEGKNAIFIKPSQQAIFTNITVVTQTGNIYTFYLTADPKKPVLQRLQVLPPETETDSALVATPGVMPTVEATPAAGGTNVTAVRRGIDPEEVQRLLQQVKLEEQEKARAEKKSFAEAMLIGRNDNYDVAYDPRPGFKIVNIFDVGGVTYIRTKTAEGAQPNFFIVGDDGNNAVVQWTVSPEDKAVIMVDRVFKEGIVQVGTKRARIRNKGLSAALKREVGETKGGRNG